MIHHFFVCGDNAGKYTFFLHKWLRNHLLFKSCRHFMLYSHDVVYLINKCHVCSTCVNVDIHSRSSSQLDVSKVSSVTTL